MGRAVGREQAVGPVAAGRPAAMTARQAELAALALLLLTALGSRLVIPSSAEADLAAPRWALALGHVTLLAVFYLACRARCSAVTTLAAAALLGFGDWALAIAHRGDRAVFAATCAVLAALVLERAGSGKSRWPWVGAGLLAGAGWYVGPSGVPILPALLLPALVGLSHRAERRRTAIGVAVLAGTFLVAILPSVILLLARRDEVAGSVASWSAVEGAPTAELPQLLATGAGQVVRAYLVLDPTLGARAGTLPPGRAVLDGFSGTLFLIGLVVGVRGGMAGPWWSLLVVPLLLVQLAASRVPDPSLAIVALPAYFLFVGLAIDRIVRAAPARPVVFGALLVAVPAICWTNWQAYAGRGLPTGTVGRAVVTRTGPIAAVPVVTITPAGQAPRGVAVMDGVVFVVGAGGRLARLTPDAVELVELPAGGDGRLGGGDLAAGADSHLYLTDAERNLVVKLSSDGRVVRTFGESWGMYRPRGLAVAKDGRLFVADTGRDRILVATPEGQLLRSVGGPSTPGLLDQPTDVAVDDSGRIYVALPEAGRLVVLDETGATIGAWPIGRGGTIDSPRLAVIADDALAVSEPSARQIRFFDPGGRQLGEIAAGLGLPVGLAAEGDRLFVADPGAGRLLVFALNRP